MMLTLRLPFRKVRDPDPLTSKVPFLLPDRSAYASPKNRFPSPT